MCEKVTVSFDINLDDLELQTMDLLLQVMKRFDMEAKMIGMVDYESDWTKERMTQWLFERYKEDA
jgi:hypothetical protein